jgi:hypothetical protein
MAYPWHLGKHKRRRKRVERTTNWTAVRIARIITCMTTQLWEDTDSWSDVVGVITPPVYPAAYNAVIMTECPACKAPILAMCLNSVTKTARRAPCVARVTASKCSRKW